MSKRVQAYDLFEDHLRQIDSIEKVENRCVEIVEVLGVVTNVANIMVDDMEGGFLVMDGANQEDIYRNCSMATDMLFNALNMFKESATFARELMKEETVASTDNGTGTGSERCFAKLGDPGE